MRGLGPMSGPWRVRVGSANAAKLEAVRLGLAPLGALQIQGCAVASGVPEQPVGLDQIIAGARNRARAAHAGAPHACDLAAGIEDGLIPLPQAQTGYLNLGCCVLFDGQREALGFTAGFEYPPECVRQATGPERRPIGDVFEEVFTADPCGPEAKSEPEPEPGWGNIGRLTRGALTRAQYGAQAVTCALVRHLNPGLFPSMPVTP